MNQALGGFVLIPLQVADQTRAIIDHAQQHRRHPHATAREYLAGTMMEVEVPQGADMVNFETSHLKAFQPLACGECTGGGALGLRLAEHALCFEIAPDRGIGGNRGVATLECGA